MRRAANAKAADLNGFMMVLYLVVVVLIQKMNSVVGELLLCKILFSDCFGGKFLLLALDRHNRAKAPRECLALDKSSISGSTRETFHPPQPNWRRRFSQLYVCAHYAAIIKRTR